MKSNADARSHIPSSQGVANATVANLASAAVVGAVAVVYLAYAVRTGLSVGSAVRAMAAIGLVQVLPGALMWRSVRPRSGWLLEDLSMGFALGIAFSVPTQVVAGLSRQRWLAVAIPLAVAALLLVIPATRRRIRSATWAPIPWWLSPMVALVSFWSVRQLVAYFRRNELTWPGLGTPHIDVYLHQALASQLLTRGPTSWPTVAGEDLGYHWFTHAWLAHVTATSGVGLDVVLMRVMPALMPLTLVVCVMVAALRLSGSPKVALLAPVLAMCASGGNPLGMAATNYPINPDSPTLALGVPTLLALVILLGQRWRKELPPAAYVLVPLLSVIAAGTKGATSPLIVAGLALAAAAMFVWNRALCAKVLVDLVVVAGGLVFALVVVFHGSSAGLALGLQDAADQTFTHEVLGELPDDWLVGAAAGLAVFAGLTRAALAFVPLFGRRSRRDPMPWLLAGGSLAGAGAIAVFSHPGLSQYYFLSTAIPLAALGSAMGARALVSALGKRAVGRLLPLAVGAGALIHLAPTRLVGQVTEGAFDTFWEVLTAAAVIVVVTGVAASILTPTGGRLRAVLATLAVAGLASGCFAALNSVHAPLFPQATRPDTLRVPTAVSQAQIDPARYIREHSDVDDLVMTNRHCTRVRGPFGGCDSRRWLVTAYSERQALVEGWTATPEATRRAPHGRDSITVDYWKPDILRLNDGFIAAPTVEAQQKLWDLGVRWVYVDKLMPHADTLAPFATLGLDTRDAAAWKLSAPPGAKS